MEQRARVLADALEVKLTTESSPDLISNEMLEAFAQVVRWRPTSGLADRIRHLCYRALEIPVVGAWAFYAELLGPELPSSGPGISHWIEKHALEEASTTLFTPPLSQQFSMELESRLGIPSQLWLGLSLLLVDPILLRTCPSSKKQGLDEAMSQFDVAYDSLTTSQRRHIRGRHGTNRPEFMEACYHEPPLADLNDAAAWMVAEVVRDHLLAPVVEGSDFSFDAFADADHLFMRIERDKVDLATLQRRWSSWLERAFPIPGLRGIWPWPFRKGELAVAASVEEFPSSLARQIHDAAIWEIVPQVVPRWRDWSQPKSKLELLATAGLSFASWKQAQDAFRTVGIDSRKDQMQTIRPAISMCALSYNPYYDRPPDEEGCELRGRPDDVERLRQRELQLNSPEADEIRSRVVLPSVRTLAILCDMLSALPGGEKLRDGRHRQRSPPLHRKTDDSTEVDGEKYYYLDAVARLIGVSKSTVTRWLKRGLAPPPQVLHVPVVPKKGKPYEVTYRGVSEHDLPLLQLLALKNPVFAKMAGVSLPTLEQHITQTNAQHPGLNRAELRGHLLKRYGFESMEEFLRRRPARAKGRSVRRRRRTERSKREKPSS